MQAAKRIGSGIAQEIATAPTGEALRVAMAEQVRLITSLPLEAGQRVHKLAIEGLSTGRRASEVAKDILATGEVTKSRANLIARTETGRASAEFSKARAQSVGSTHFIWHTAGDRDVRPSHAKLNGQVFRWDQPPECDPGHHALPGAIFNCRCYPEPVLTDR
jgi:SPP1 gp7 family putative phage head morphogenesis protein